MHYTHRDILLEMDGLVSSRTIHASVQLKVLVALIDVAKSARSLVADLSIREDELSQSTLNAYRPLRDALSIFKIPNDYGGPVG